MGNLVSCVEDNIFNPVESEITPPSVHAQEEKYRLACEHHQTQVAALAAAQKDVDDLKKAKKKVSTKISEFVGNPSDRKRKVTALERCKLHLAEALEIKAEAKFELDEALKIQHEYVEVEKEKRKDLSKYLESEKEKKRAEEERLRVQKRLAAERASLEREERLRQLREQRHSKEAMLDRGVVQEAQIHPRTQKVDPELAKFLEEAEDIILEGNNADTIGSDQDERSLPSPVPKGFTTAFPPSSPGESGSTVVSPSAVPKNLEASSPADSVPDNNNKHSAQLSPTMRNPKEGGKTPQSAPWRKSKSKFERAPDTANEEIEGRKQQDVATESAH